MSDENTKEYKLVVEKQKEMKKVFDRMDEDEKLYYLEPYEMMQLPPNHHKKMPEVANMTQNDSLLYAIKAISVISGATMQTVVEGQKMKDPQTTTIERLLDDVLYMVDEQLPKRKYPGMDAFINEQICIRGRISGRSCIRFDGEKGLILDILPLDTRSYVDETDGNDIVWAAPSFRRSKAEVERQYQKEGDRKVTLSAYPIVIPYWDNKKNTIFVDKQIIREQENPYGYVPFVSIVCPTGSFLNTEAAAEHEGESIFWVDRDLWEEKSRMMTIMQTMNVNALFGALEYASQAGEEATPPEKPPYQQRTVHAVEIGGGYKPIPTGDINAATRLLYSILEAALQRGSLSAIDYGTLTFPLSAIAITRLTGSRDDIFLPRIQAKALFYQALSRMIIKQCMAISEPLELGQEGSKNTYQKSELEGDYSIKYRFFTESSEQMIANLSIANAAEGILSPDTLRREVLKLKDPDGEKVKFESAQAERVDEVLFLFRRADSLLDEVNGEKPTVKNKIEAFILSERIITILEQRRNAGQLSPIEGKVEPGQALPQGKQVVPLGTEGRGVGGAAAPTPAEPGTAQRGENEQAS